MKLEEIQAILSPEEVKRQLEEIDRREEDRRTLSGEFAPPEYVCRVCGGCVAAVRAFSRSDLIGGQAPRAFIDHWRCEGCGLRYEGLTTLKVPLKQWGT